MIDSKFECRILWNIDMLVVERNKKIISPSVSGNHDADGEENLLKDKNFG